MVQVVGANGVRVEVQATEVGNPEQPGRVVDDDLVGRPTGRKRQLDRSDPFGSGFGSAFLEEEVAGRAVDVAL